MLQLMCIWTHSDWNRHNHTSAFWCVKTLANINGDYMVMIPWFAFLWGQMTKTSINSVTFYRVFIFVSVFWFLFSSFPAHGGVSIDSKSTGRQPEGDSSKENPSKPPPVRVIGGSPSASWLQPCSLALLFAGLGLQWMLLWRQPCLCLHLFIHAPCGTNTCTELKS